MSFGSIQSAFDTYFQTMSGLTDQIAWPHVTFVPDQAKTYWAPRMASIVRTPAGAGEKGVVRWEGTYQVSVLVPKATEGTATLLALVDTILNHFKRGTSLLTGDGLTIVTEVPRPTPTIAEPERNTGVVIVPWFVNEFPT